jgi:superfamily II DNA helicase RecQ
MAPKKKLQDTFAGIPDEESDAEDSGNGHHSDDDNGGRSRSDSSDSERGAEEQEKEQWSNVDDDIHTCKKSSCTRLAVYAIGNNDPEYCIDCGQKRKNYVNIEEKFTISKDAASAKMTLNKLTAAFTCFFTEKECDVDDIKKIISSTKRSAAAASSRSTATKRAKT